jgi:hypothetical protein
VQTLVDDLYEIYSAKIQETRIVSSTAAAKKGEDFARAEVLRNASLGMLTPKAKQQLIGIDRSASSTCSTTSTDNCNKKQKRQHQQQSELASMIEMYDKRMAQRHKPQESKEARKKTSNVFRSVSLTFR